MRKLVLVSTASYNKQERRCIQNGKAKMANNQEEVVANVLFNFLYVKLRCNITCQIFIKIFFRLQNYGNNVDILELDESMFIKVCIDPFMDVIFGLDCGLQRQG